MNYLVLLVVLVVLVPSLWLASLLGAWAISATGRRFFGQGFEGVRRFYFTKFTDIRWRGMVSQQQVYVTIDRVSLHIHLLEFIRKLFACKLFTLRIEGVNVCVYVDPKRQLESPSTTGSVVEFVHGDEDDQAESNRASSFVFITLRTIIFIVARLVGIDISGISIRAASQNEFMSAESTPRTPSDARSGANFGDKDKDKTVMEVVFGCSLSAEFSKSVSEMSITCEFEPAIGYYVTPTSVRKEVLKMSNAALTMAVVVPSYSRKVRVTVRSVELALGVVSVMYCIDFHKFITSLESDSDHHGDDRNLYTWISHLPQQVVLKSDQMKAMLGDEQTGTWSAVLSDAAVTMYALKNVNSDDKSLTFSMQWIGPYVALTRPPSTGTIHEHYAILDCAESSLDGRMSANKDSSLLTLRGSFVMAGMRLRLFPQVARAVPDVMAMYQKASLKDVESAPFRRLKLNMLLTANVTDAAAELYQVVVTRCSESALSMADLVKRADKASDEPIGRLFIGILTAQVETESDGRAAMAGLSRLECSSVLSDCGLWVTSGKSNAKVSLISVGSCDVNVSGVSPPSVLFAVREMKAVMMPNLLQDITLSLYDQVRHLRLSPSSSKVDTLSAIDMFIPTKITLRTFDCLLLSGHSIESCVPIGRISGKAARAEIQLAASSMKFPAVFGSTLTNMAASAMTISFWDETTPYSLPVDNQGFAVFTKISESESDPLLVCDSGSMDLVDTWSNGQVTVATKEAEYLIHLDVTDVCISEWRCHRLVEVMNEFKRTFGMVSELDSAPSRSLNRPMTSEQKTKRIQITGCKVRTKKFGIRLVLHQGTKPPDYTSFSAQTAHRCVLVEADSVFVQWSRATRYFELSNLTMSTAQSFHIDGDVLTIDSDQQSPFFSIRTTIVERIVTNDFNLHSTDEAVPAWLSEYLSKRHNNLLLYVYGKEPHMILRHSEHRGIFCTLRRLSSAIDDIYELYDAEFVNHNTPDLEWAAVLDWDDFLMQMNEDNFQFKLKLNHSLGLDEQEERIKRIDLLEGKMADMNGLTAAKMSAARNALMEKNSSIFIQRMAFVKDKAALDPPLFKAHIASLLLCIGSTVPVERITWSQNMAKLIDPTSAWGLSLAGDLTSFDVSYRDYIDPLLHCNNVTCWGGFWICRDWPVPNEYASDPVLTSSIGVNTVQLKQYSDGIHRRQSRLFVDLSADINGATASYGKSYEACMISISNSTELYNLPYGITNDMLPPSLPWWDVLRRDVVFRTNLTVVAGEVSVLVSPSPYEGMERLVSVCDGSVITYLDGMLSISSTGVHVVPIWGTTGDEPVLFEAGSVDITIQQVWDGPSSTILQDYRSYLLQFMPNHSSSSKEKDHGAYLHDHSLSNAHSRSRTPYSIGSSNSVLPSGTPSSIPINMLDRYSLDRSHKLSWNLDIKCTPDIDGGGVGVCLDMNLAKWLSSLLEMWTEYSPRIVDLVLTKGPVYPMLTFSRILQKIGVKLLLEYPKFELFQSSEVQEGLRMVTETFLYTTEMIKQDINDPVFSRLFMYHARPERPEWPVSMPIVPKPQWWCYYGSKCRCDFTELFVYSPNNTDEEYTGDYLLKATAITYSQRQDNDVFLSPPSRMDESFTTQMLNDGIVADFSHQFVVDDAKLSWTVDTRNVVYNWLEIYNTYYASETMLLDEKIRRLKRIGLVSNVDVDGVVEETYAPVATPSVDKKDLNESDNLLKFLLSEEFRKSPASETAYSSPPHLKSASSFASPVSQRRRVRDVFKLEHLTNTTCIHFNNPQIAFTVKEGVTLLASDAMDYLWVVSSTGAPGLGEVMNIIAPDAARLAGFKSGISQAMTACVFNTAMVFMTRDPTAWLTPKTMALIGSNPQGIGVDGTLVPVTSPFTASTVFTSYLDMNYRNSTRTRTSRTESYDGRVTDIYAIRLSRLPLYVDRWQLGLLVDSIANVLIGDSPYHLNELKSMEKVGFANLLHGNLLPQDKLKELDAAISKLQSEIDKIDNDMQMLMSNKSMTGKPVKLSKHSRLSSHAKLVHGKQRELHRRNTGLSEPSREAERAETLRLMRKAKMWREEQMNTLFAQRTRVLKQAKATDQVEASSKPISTLLRGTVSSEAEAVAGNGMKMIYEYEFIDLHIKESSVIDTTLHNSLTEDLSINGLNLVLHANVFANLQVNQLVTLSYIFEDWSGYYDYNVQHLNIINCDKNALFDIVAVSKHAPAATRMESGRQFALRMIFAERPKVGGIHVYSLTELNISPMKANIEMEFTKKLSKFFLESSGAPVPGPDEPDDKTDQNDGDVTPLTPTSDPESDVIVPFPLITKSPSGGGQDELVTSARKPPRPKIVINQVMATDGPGSVTRSPFSPVEKRPMSRPRTFSISGDPLDGTLLSSASLASRSKARHRKSLSYEQALAAQTFAEEFPLTESMKHDTGMTSSGSFDSNSDALLTATTSFNTTIPGTVAEKVEALTVITAKQPSESKEVDLMRKRADATVMFVVLRVTEIEITLSVHGPAGPINLDFRDWAVKLSSLEYHDRAVSWSEIIEELKKDISLDVLSKLLRRNLMKKDVQSDEQRPRSVSFNQRRRSMSVNEATAVDDITKSKNSGPVVTPSGSSASSTESEAVASTLQLESIIASLRKTKKLDSDKKKGSTDDLTSVDREMDERKERQLEQAMKADRILGTSTLDAGKDTKKKRFWSKNK